MLALLCCLILTAQNTVTKCEYWLDRQFDDRTTVSVTDGQVNAEIDLAPLDVGLHSIGIRVFDGEGAISSVLTKYFIVLPVTEGTGNGLANYEYWLDRNFDKRVRGVLSKSGTADLDLDLGSLNVGVHSIGMRVNDAIGQSGSVLTKYFMVLPVIESGANGLVNYEYWLDRNFDKRVSGVLSKSGTAHLDLDLKSLNVGVHNIAMRVNDAIGQSGSVLTKYFMVLPVIEGTNNGLMNYEYWLDRDFKNRISGSVGDGGIVDLDLDISSLKVGIHNIAMRVSDKVGKESSVLMKYFMVTGHSGGGDNALTACEYWIDNDFDQRQSSTLTDGVLNLDIDIAKLRRGMHNFYVRTLDEAKQVSAVYKHIFIVAEEERPLLARYGYWFNDSLRSDMNIRHTDRLDTNLTIDLEGLTPHKIQPDYIFDVATQRILTSDTITVGLQVFNANGTGSEAVVDTLKGITLSVDPKMQAISNEQTNVLPALREGEVQGYSFDTAAGDSLYWIVNNEGVSLDFFDADGAPLKPDTVEVDTTRMLAMKAQTDKVYVLAYGVCDGKANSVLVSKPIVVSALNYEREYGDENPDFGFSAKGADVIGEPQIECEATVLSPVGTYPIVIRKGAVANHNDSYVNGTLTVTKAMLTVSVEDVVRDELEENPEFVIHYDGFKNGEDSTVLIKLPVATTDAEFYSDLGDYDIIVSGGEAENYDFTYVNGTLSIQVISGVRAVTTAKPVDVYTVNGIKIRTQVTEFTDLPDGVYIINGRKVLLNKNKH